MSCRLPGITGSATDLRRGRPSTLSWRRPAARAPDRSGLAPQVAASGVPYGDTITNRSPIDRSTSPPRLCPRAGPRAGHVAPGPKGSRPPATRAARVASIQPARRVPKMAVDAGAGGLECRDDAPAHQTRRRGVFDRRRTGPVQPEPLHLAPHPRSPSRSAVARVGPAIFAGFGLQMAAGCLTQSRRSGIQNASSWTRWRSSMAPSSVSEHRSHPWSV